MALRPICEPVELPPGISLIAERVSVEEGATGVGDFMHFHDLAELVLFKRVSGYFLAEGSRKDLCDGAVVFVPSMRHHDFILEARAMEWVLIQFDPDLVLDPGPRSGKLMRPFIVVPDEPLRTRIGLLVDWLVESAKGPDPKTERILGLLLLAITEVEGPCAFDAPSSAVQRLAPVLDHLRAAPAEPIALETAASLCQLSPAYFSRCFRRLFGMSFTQYARTYRLRLAARRLIGSAEAISKIGYGVGFSNPAHFTARFRERFGMSPREYRASAGIRTAGEGRTSA